MITYKNISYSAKTFYGVKFNPGETKSVPGYINHKGMVRIFGSPNLGMTDISKAKVEEVEQKPEQKPESEPITLFEEPKPSKVETRGRKKKSTEPEKDSFAENKEIKLETTQEDTTDGNYC